MALQVCLGCTTAYAAGAAQCPHCGSSEWAEEGTGEAMAKISVHGGPSNVDVPLVSEEGPEVELPEGGVVSSADVEAPADGADGEVNSEARSDGEDDGSTGDELVPEGNVDEVIAWTEDDPEPPARIRRALAAEGERATPRVTLTTELERRLAQL